LVNVTLSAEQTDLDPVVTHVWPKGQSACFLQEAGDVHTPSVHTFPSSHVLDVLQATLAASSPVESVALEVSEGVALVSEELQAPSAAATPMAAHEKRANAGRRKEDFMGLFTIVSGVFYRFAVRRKESTRAVEFLALRVTSRLDETGDDSRLRC